MRQWGKKGRMRVFLSENDREEYRRRINAYAVLAAHRGQMTQQQIRTIRGQIRAGDTMGALRGIQRVVDKNREEAKREERG